MAIGKLIALYDGTWCGEEANTKTTIYQLAEMIMNGNNPYNTKPTAPYFDQAHHIKACYFPGPGIGDTFLQNVITASFGSDIDSNCIELYEYIANNYKQGDEIWMFGHSRGAYTIRCVVGMINNCGILKNPTNQLCRDVYEKYRNRLPTYHPAHPNMIAFRAANSHNVRTPVKFMGLFDSVGSLGIPYLAPNIGLAYRQFHDNAISSVVEKVYHAMAIHDRLWGFEPCHATPSRTRLVVPTAHSPAPQFEIRERWFPGCHYDLGRQRFRFLQNGANFLERTVNYVLNPLSQIIEPNNVCADLVVKWMLERIQQNDPQQRVIQDIGVIIQGLIANMANATPADTGSGDVYDNILNYGPFGAPGGYLFKVVSKLLPHFGVAISLLSHTKDREIDLGAELTQYTQPCKMLGERTVGDVGGINDQRYPSQTYRDFINIPISQLNPTNPRSSAC
ncbi:hypothetical protein BGZ95_008801 [Linnemannia exigua]|uniref:T6SS Phospholipase effector Tle1-like catalytic domain-containing protein n=1 Tax=Linnemannia exigua TaxID=604196 RepID=A0AAD4DFF4_9FUNG|nr:hypothetical protein BGZ95_008801 [Linnemannia exigua]